MTIAKNKIVLPLFALFVLSGCGSNYAGVASETSFVTVVSSDEVNIASSTVKTKTSTLSGTAATSSSSSSSTTSSSSSSSTSDATSAHTANIYTNGNYKYVNGSTTYIGYSSTSSSGKTHYYLINGTTSLGLLYSSFDGLQSYYDLTEGLITSDYAVIEAAYDKIQTYAGKSASDVGALSLSLLYSDITSTVGYNFYLKTEDNDNYYEDYYFVTMDRVGTSDTYAFTDYIYRKITTSKSTGAITFNVTEYTLSVVDAYSDMSISLSAYTISLAGVDTSSIDASVVDQSL
jgi:hypothetical protein